MKRLCLISLLLLIDFPTSIHAQAAMYDATGDATTFLLTVMVPLLAITLFETERQKHKSLRTILDDFIIYISLLTPTGFFYFYIIKNDITHTKIIGILIALVPAMVILAFELLYIMRENFFRRFKRYWSAIYAFLFVANVIAVGFVYASETVNNLRTINPYFVAPICEGPFKSFRCGLSSVLLTTAMAFAFLLLFLPLCGCCVSPFYIRFLSTSCHAIVISMLTLVVGWPLSNNVYVTKIVLAIGALSITRIINRFKDFEGETINDQGQTEKSKRVLLSHFLFDFEKYSDYEYEQTRYVV